MDKKGITFSRICSAIWRRIKFLPDYFWFYLPFGFPYQNRKRLKSLNNSHKGERCFILANGPSLKKVNFDLLKNEFTFGMNRIYMMKDVNGFVPSCIACMDEDTLLYPFREDFDSLKIMSFFPFRDRKWFSKKENQYFFGSGRFSPKFQTDAAENMGNGKTIAYLCIQMAFCMGFDKVYIIGKDHTYNVSAKPGAKIDANNDNGNHFISGYYKAGTKWDAPDHETEEYAYVLARKEFEKYGRGIFNATEGGKLELFERVDFNSLFPGANNITKCPRTSIEKC